MGDNYRRLHLYLLLYVFFLFLLSLFNIIIYYYQQEELKSEKVSDFGQADGSYMHDGFEQSEGLFTVICIVTIITNDD